MKFGVVMCNETDTLVIAKAVCYNERSAETRGRAWKRRNPKCIVRVVSLMPGDTSDPRIIKLVPLFHERPR